MSEEVKTPPQTEEEAPERKVVFEEALEAILFAAGHPVTYNALAGVFHLTPAKVKDMVFEYSLKYNTMKLARGVILLTFADSCQLCTKQYYLPEIREALGIKKSGTLSTSSMEALAIVAYNQPVTRMFVDTLRRADSSYAMNNLLDRGLIESKGRLDVPGRPMLFGTTNDFLRCFGLRSLEELPETSEELINLFANTKNVADNGEDTVDGQEAIDIDDIVLHTEPKEEPVPSAEGDGTEERDAAVPTEEELGPSAEDDIFFPDKEPASKEDEGGEDD